MRRQEAFDWLSAVRKEWAAASLSVVAMSHASQADPAVLARSADEIRPADLRDCLDHLEITYLLRLYAEFEGVLRSYWAAARPAPRRGRTQMQTLIERVAALRNVPADSVDEVHAVRELRNEIVHHRLLSAALSIEECKSRLGRFLAWLPLNW